MLNNTSESVGDRVEAAYGLGRYVERPETKGSWRDIVECFRGVLGSERLYSEVYQQVLSSMKKYGSSGIAFEGAEEAPT